MSAQAPKREENQRSVGVVPWKVVHMKHWSMAPEGQFVVLVSSLSQNPS